MTKIGIVYWTSSGNTGKLAEAVKEGAEKAGAQVDLIEAEVFDPSTTASYDALGFGCPAMGVEQLEESIFEPMFESAEGMLSGKKIALFGSYGWGGGQWMKDWQERVANDGGKLVDDGLAVNGEPDADALAKAEELGAKLA